ncbi:MAG: tetratricopeptide repeat protein, partial [Verrucomicrobia bacterium]|nr:tetratricopeptide repeat protein [Verrucomicrobiota bacterium]
MNLFSLLALFFILLLPINSLTAAQWAGEEWDRQNAEIDLLHREGKIEDAIKVAKSALDLAEEAVGTDNRDYLRSLENLGLLHQFNQEYGVAESLFN